MQGLTRECLVQLVLLTYSIHSSSQISLEHLTDSPNLSIMSTGYNDGMNEEMGSYEHIPSRCQSPELILPETSGMMVPQKRRHWDDDEDDALSQNMPSSSKKRMDCRFDETEMFFLSMSETVKRLRPVDQSRIKKELCNLVYEAEIRLLEEAEEMGHS